MIRHIMRNNIHTSFISMTLEQIHQLLNTPDTCPNQNMTARRTKITQKKVPTIHQHTQETFNISIIQFIVTYIKQRGGEYNGVLHVKTQTVLNHNIITSITNLSNLPIII